MDGIKHIRPGMSVLLVFKLSLNGLTNIIGWVIG